jgi:sugar O-acyltransferase (sialic acid O-acetyltransferase NeuD family)
LDLLIIGAGGHGKVVADAARMSTRWNRIFFIDDIFPKNKKCSSWDIIGSIDTIKLDPNAEYIVAIGDNHTRFEVFSNLKDRGMRFACIVHPTAYISPESTIGFGTVVLANAVINIGSSLGDCCIVNTSSTIDHDCVIKNSVHISPGVNLAGEVNVGSFSWIGIGAAVRQQVSIGKDVVVGAGAAVVSDIKDNTTVVGIPAKPIKVL